MSRCQMMAKPSWPQSSLIILGLAIAGRFRRAGARVVITGRDHDLGGRAEQALGPGVRFVAADAADPDAIAPSVRAAADHLGGLDVLVNNAISRY